MSVPPKTDQDIPDPHRRTLPHFPINEQGMRELEIWIKGFLGGLTGIFYKKRNVGRWLDIETTGGSGPSGHDAALHGDELLLDYTFITTDGDPMDIRTEGGGFTTTTEGGGWEVDTDGGGVDFRDCDFTIREVDDAVTFSVRDLGGYGLDIDPTLNSQLILHTGQTFKILDNGGGVLAVFTG